MSDFSRDTFDPKRPFSRVLMQQGRVQLDSDWNEQVAIFTQALRDMAKELIGPWGGPAAALGFQIGQPTRDGFTIGDGVYYVDGIRCENESPLSYAEQPHAAESARVAREASRPLLEEGKAYLVYLDVWERIVTHVEYPSIREVALLGPDTAVRAQIVWQVKFVDVTDKFPSQDGKDALSILHEKLNIPIQQPTMEILQPTMEARVTEGASPTDACIASPEARYRGLENQLYRIEVHEGGFMPPDGTPIAQNPTFKWSRENGSVAFPLEKGPEQDGDFLTVTLGHLGRDSRFGLVEGDWVELQSEDTVLTNAVQPLLRVVRVNPSTRRVTLTRPPGGTISLVPPEKRPLLRRWDQTVKRGHAVPQGPVPIVEDRWIPLEDGIEVRFDSKGTDVPAKYNRGDYWLIPARTATGRIEWEPGRKQPPRGVDHYLAPLAAFELKANDTKVLDFRLHFQGAAVPVAP